MTSPPTPFTFADTWVIIPLDVERIATPNPGIECKSLYDLYTLNPGRLMRLINSITGLP